MEPERGNPVTYFVTLWACYCTDAATDVTSFPETCPCHGARSYITPVDPKRPGPMTLGHRCPEEPA